MMDLGCKFLLHGFLKGVEHISKCEMAQNGRNIRRAWILSSVLLNLLAKSRGSRYLNAACACLRKLAS